MENSNRTIKFRAWHKSRGFMSDVLALHFDTNQVSLALSKNGAVQYLWDIGYIKLMQYTEQKDKNGKDIYGGDICEVEYLKDKYIGQVEYRNGAFWIVKHNGYGGEGYFLHNIYDDTKISNGIVKKIGNIHENPEILKE